MKKLFKLIKSIAISVYQAIINNPEVKKLVGKYPRFFRFIKKRLHWRDFWGLPVTFISLILFYIIILFFGVVADILSSDPIAFADVNLAGLVYTFRNSLLVQILFKITLLGDWPLILGATIIFSLILWLWPKKMYLLPFWLTLGCSAFFGYISKLIIHRPRPADIAIFDLSSFAFPSGHATLCTALYGFIAYFLFRQIRKKSYKIIPVIGFLFLILIIGFSRIYLGFHYLSDVLGGYLLGLFWLIVGISLMEWYFSWQKKETSVDVKPQRKLLLSSLVIIFIIFYGIWGFFYNPAITLSQQHPVIQLTSNDIGNLFTGSEDLPKYSETPTSKKQEPISFIVVAKDNAALIQAFSKVNWFLADSPTLSAILKLGKSAFLNQAYPTAPVTPVFWAGEVNNFGFEKPTEQKTVRARHHARFWQTYRQLNSGQQVYVGTASLDEGLKWLFTHKINPDLDTEREFIFSELQKADLIASWQKIKLVEPQLNKNFSGDYFFTDGHAYIIYLK